MMTDNIMPMTKISTTSGDFMDTTMTMTKIDHSGEFMYRIDHSYEEYMSPYILPVCGFPRGKAEARNRKRGVYTGSYTPSIRGLSDLYHGNTNARN